MRSRRRYNRERSLKELEGSLRFAPGRTSRRWRRSGAGPRTRSLGGPGSAPQLRPPLPAKERSRRRRSGGPPQGGASTRARPLEVLDFSSLNFKRSVLSCINADFCDQILILQRFSSSIRFSHFCTARNSDFLQKISSNFVRIFQKFAKF